MGLAKEDELTRQLNNMEKEAMIEALKDSYQKRVIDEEWPKEFGQDFEGILRNLMAKCFEVGFFGGVEYASNHRR